MKKLTMVMVTIAINCCFSASISFATTCPDPSLIQFNNGVWSTADGQWTGKGPTSGTIESFEYATAANVGFSGGPYQFNGGCNYYMKNSNSAYLYLSNTSYHMVCLQGSNWSQPADNNIMVCNAGINDCPFTLVSALAQSC